MAITRIPTDMIVDRASGEKLSTSLAQKANQDSNVFNKNTYGTYEKATVLSAIANEGDNPKPQVLGFTNSQQSSTYSDRDTVALFVSNRTRNPTLSVNTGTITYSNLSVQVTGVTIANLDKIKSGMLIDTLHTPNPFSSLVDHVDIATQTIYVVDGWYEVKTGGSTTPAIPSSGIGFDVDKITKAWGINNNVFIQPNDPALKAVAEEIGLFNYKDTGNMGGIDVANFQKKAQYGFQTRKLSSAEAGFLYSLLAADSDVGVMYVNANGIALASNINGENTDQGFQINAKGRLSKLKLHLVSYGNGSTTYVATTEKMFILNKTVVENFELPSPTTRDGELIFVVNTGTATANLTIRGVGSFVKGNTVTTLSMPAKTQITFISDGTYWFALGGNFDMNIKGNLTLDNAGTTGIEMGSTTVVGTQYIDFHSSGNNIDHDVRMQVTGGTSTVGKGTVNYIAGTVQLNGKPFVTYMTGTASPVSVVTPDFVGQVYVDTTNLISYMACSLVSSGWKQITN